MFVYELSGCGFESSSSHLRLSGCGFESSCSFLLFDSFGIEGLKNFIVKDNEKIVAKVLKGVENLKEDREQINIVKLTLSKIAI